MFLQALKLRVPGFFPEMGVWCTSCGTERARVGCRFAVFGVRVEGVEAECGHGDERFNMIIGCDNVLIVVEKNRWGAGLDGWGEAGARLC